MRSLLVFLACFAGGVATLGAQDAKVPTTLNVLTFNLRYNEPRDGVNAWPNRKAMAAKVVTDEKADFAGMQEALAGMIEDLQAQLPQYAWTGVGREDGQSKGEYAPIFYLKDKYTLEQHGTFWLSETPEVVGSQSWDAALPRIATWGIFRENATGKKFFVMNTHFDHKGKEARRQSAKLLIGKIVELSGSLPVILTGDFNTTPESAPVETLTEDARLKLTDSAKITETPHTGGEASMHGFGTAAKDEIIDYVFVGPRIGVKSHAYLKIKEGEVYVSDHWPVASQVVVP